MEDDGIYAKKVSRRMLQMTRHINTDWKPHVQATGVVCWTCHRGQPVPANVWYENPGSPHAGGFTATNDGMGHTDKANGWIAMSQDPYTPLLEKAGVIRVQAKQALPAGADASIQSTEQTYALMMSISNGLGVNCTFCHNTREFGQWPESAPQRVTAWHGIQMVRDLNDAYLDPLKDAYPAHLLGPLGDAPKANCATCHQGASKPLLGVSLAKDYPELGGAPSPK
jgi:photosynthetic reaction center cytochrome c subunit